MLLLLVELCYQLVLNFPLKISRLRLKGRFFSYSYSHNSGISLTWYFFYGIWFVFMCFCRPLPLSIGFLAQYVLKPFLGVFVARSFRMSPMFYAGFVLMSCVAGAQLSSYASFLSNGDVALSILLTSSSTIASVLVTPLLTGLLIGSVVPVDAVAMSKSILQVPMLLVLSFTLIKCTEFRFCNYWNKW